MKRIQRIVRWLRREAYAWWPSLPFSLSARIHRTMRRLRWERPRIKVDRLGQPDAPRVGWKDWDRVKGAQSKKVRDVLERKEKGEWN